MEARKIDPLRVYNVEEAANVLSINPQTLLDYLRDGRIVAQKIGEWKILGQSLIDFITKNPVKVLVKPDSIKYGNDDGWTPRVFIQEVKEFKYGESMPIITWEWKDKKLPTKDAADKVASFNAKQILRIQYGIKAE